MGDLKHFVAKSDRHAEANLSEFIRFCRYDLTVFGSDLDWANHKWPGVRFTKLGVKTYGSTNADRLDGAWIEFAKAYFRYQQGHHPTETKNESKALRVIEAALLKCGRSATISSIDYTTLDEAAQLLRSHYFPLAAYQGGRELQRLARFISEKQLIGHDLSLWRTPIKKPSDITIQTGAKAKTFQEKKLPNQDAIDAMAEIFALNGNDPKEIFTSSTFAMTMCAPVRISEILHLPLDCEVEQIDSSNNVQYGWRFFSAKGFEGDIKWIPTVMVPIAKEAIRRIRALTDEARSLARWIENNPEKFYRHKNCPAVPEDQPLTREQAAEALGIKNLGSTALSSQNFAHSLNSLWHWVMARQPKGLPWLDIKKKIKYSNALFCMSANLMGAQKGTSPVILWTPSVNVFNADISPRESLNSNTHQSIFDRHGYKTKAGERIKLTSHQARHLLTTLANRGGLSQEEIAKWAGRADSKQNRVYNHMSEWEMVAKAEALDTSLTLFGPKGEVSQHVPVTTQEINMMERGAMHISEWGICSHDFIMSPCEKFRDCLNCEEHVCIKGAGQAKSEELSRIKKRLALIEHEYIAAKDALNNGFSGADRWFEYHEKTVLRLRQLVEILENPKVPEGAQIKLSDGRDFSHLRRVIRIKAVEAQVKKLPDAQLLTDMTQLLGGQSG